MNLALLMPEDMQSSDRAILTGRRLHHIHETLRLEQGQSLRVGLLNRRLGTATISALTTDRAILDIQWRDDPPPPLPVTLIIALPRPKMLRRIIQTATTMGVKQLYFINSWKVEKSFWQSPWLTEEKLLENMVLGLEQAQDTQLPDIQLRKRFKPFVEDELPSIIEGTRALVAHPGMEKKCPIQLPSDQHVSLAIGPEGGFTPYECNKLMEAGFEPVHLGRRILRVETAVPVLLARLFDLS